MVPTFRVLLLIALLSATCVAKECYTDADCFEPDEKLPMYCDRALLQEIFGWPGNCKTLLCPQCVDPTPQSLFDLLQRVGHIRL
uniref:Secreted protein n=1 Tax=Panagrellus redivivus TaxID=6233 RepID=A0A7E4ZTM6_PANRE